MSFLGPLGILFSEFFFCARKGSPLYTRPVLTSYHRAFSFRWLALDLPKCASLPFTLCFLLVLLLQTDRMSLDLLASILLLIPGFLGRPISALYFWHFSTLVLEFAFVFCLPVASSAFSIVIFRPFFLVRRIVFFRPLSSSPGCAAVVHFAVISLWPAPSSGDPFLPLSPKSHDHSLQSVLTVPRPGLKQKVHRIRPGHEPFF